MEQQRVKEDSPVYGQQQEQLFDPGGAVKRRENGIERRKQDGGQVDVEKSKKRKRGRRGRGKRKKNQANGGQIWENNVQEVSGGDMGGSGCWKKGS